MRLAPILALRTPLAACACGAEPADPCRLGPYTVAGNFVVDLDGGVLSEDHGNTTIWGRRGAQAFPLKFSPPPNYGVRILRLSADLAARHTLRGAAPAVPLPGLYTGVLLAIAAKYPSAGSERADWAADDTFAYKQGDIGPSGVLRFDIAEDHEGIENNWLGPDNTLWFVVAKYLDETGLATHLEVTFSSVRYVFERKCE